MRRYMSLYFPSWPLQHLRQTNPETRAMPCALFERLAHGPVLADCSKEAREFGVRPGTSVADARALAPGLILHEWDVPACRTALEEVCLWAGRFSPWSGLEPLSPDALRPSALMLDITGCENVFRGEENILKQALEGLRKKGLVARAAIAPTFGAAWALAHFGNWSSPAIISDDHNELLAALSPLPITALRVEHDAREHLSQLGIERVGELLKQPRSTLPSRFGSALIARMDQALGVIDERVLPLRPPPEFLAARAFEYPLRNAEWLFKVIEELCAQLARDLQNAARGARQVECWLYHELAQPECVEAKLFKGSASGKHLWKLLHVRLEDFFRMPHAALMGRQAARGRGRAHVVLDAEEGVCAVALQVLSSEALGNGQMPLFDSGADAALDASESLSLLLDRLSSRLGASSVLRVRPEEDVIPERAYRAVGLQEECARTMTDVRGSDFQRPVKLLRAPVPVAVEWPQSMSWRGQRITFEKIAGPERIESGWWGECPARRDYYIVAAECGARYWIFKRLEDERWFLQGVFE